MVNYWYEGTDNVVAGTAVSMSSGDFLYVASGAHVGSSAVAIGVDGGSFANVQVYGTILSVGWIGFFSGGGNIVTIGAGGSVTGGTKGVFLGNVDNSVINHGTIAGATANGITLSAGGQSTLVNTGDISGYTAGVETSHDENAIINSGSIVSSTGQAILILGPVGSAVSNTIDNSGILAGGPGSNAIQTNDVQALITNSGHISGGIAFGNGNDTYDGATGSIVGLVDGGFGTDTLIGGDNRDRLQGGLGSDTLEGNGGRDTFIYTDVEESSGGFRDTIIGFDARRDKFDLNVSVTGIDATVASGDLDSGGNAFLNDLVAAVGAAQLGGNHAVLFTPTTGGLAGHTILVVDVNGNAGYQKNKDYVFDLTDADNLGNLDIGDFI